MKKIATLVVGILMHAISPQLHAAPSSNGDAVSQAYAISNALSTQEKIPGISLIGGQITHSQPVISGKLPYVMSYVGSVRNSLSASNDYFDQYLTTGGWTDNYQNSIRFISYNNSPTVGYYAIRLPGSRQDIWLRNIDRSVCPNNGVQRAFSSDVLGNLAYDTGANLVWACSTNGYQFTENAGGGISINYRGATYTTTSTSVTQSGTTYYRIAHVSQPQGEELTFTYDSLLNMTSVTDVYDNILTFARTYKAGTTQTSAEKRLITGVELSSGADINKQTASLTYAAYNSQDANGKSGSIYYPLTVTSTANAKTTFGYTPIKQWGIDGYLNFKKATDPTITVTNTNAAILTSVKNAANAVQREWLVTQNYASYNSNTKTYGTATVTLQVRSPIASTYANDYTLNYDDNARTVVVTTKPDGVNTGTVTYTVTPNPVDKLSSNNIAYHDDGESEITVSGSFPALTVSGNIPKSFTIHSWYDYIKKTVLANNLVITQTLDASARLENVTYTHTSLPTKQINYTYGALSDGSENPFLTPTKVTTPYLTITNVINANGQITSQIKTSSQAGSTSKTTTYSYSLLGGLLKSVDGPLAGDGDKVNYSYNYGYKTLETQVVNGVTRTTQYVDNNSFGQPKYISYPNGMTEQFVYNADGTVQSKARSPYGVTVAGPLMGQVTSYTYDALKRVVTETNPDREVTKYEYDSLNRPVKITHPDGSISNKVYYPNNVVKSEELRDSANSVIYRASYQDIDSNGRVSRTQSGTSTDRYWQSYLYDANGNKTQATSRLGIIEKWEYDAYNRLISHTDGNGKVDNKSYDLEDNVKSATDAVGSGSNPFEYINGGVLKKEVNADFNTKTYSYDGADQLTRVVHFARQCDFTNIDDLGRIGGNKCNRNNGATTSSTLIHDYLYTYDTSRFGRLESVNSVSNLYGTDTSYTYDDYDRVISKTQNVKAISQWGGTTPTRKVSYTYTTGGKLTSLTLPSGRKINYVYDTTKKGQLLSINQDGTNIIGSTTFDDGGQVTSWTWGNDGTYNIAYDSSKNGVIKTIRNNTSADVENYKANYIFDNDGRISAITGRITRDSYTYDNVNRLLTETRTNVSGGATLFGITYTYDNNGNRLSLAATGAHEQPAANVTYAYTAGSNRMSNITRNGVAETPAYYNEGEMLLKNSFDATYDWAGQRRWSGGEGGVATEPEYYMAYNHQRERTVRSIRNNGSSWSTNAIQYVYDEASHLLGEYKSDGTPVVEYVWKGDVPVAAIYGTVAATKIYYIVTDAQNTPRRLVDSSNDAVVWAWDSTSFGVAPPSVQTVKFNLRFPGQYYDELTKQHYNLNRYYNPEIGRYMEADPVGLEGGLNPYAYAGSNPVMSIDPTGLAWVNVWLQKGSFGKDDFQWGHASMTLKDGTYISWWPNQAAGIIDQKRFVSDIYTAPAFTDRTFEKDKTDEGSRMPDYRVEVFSLDETKIKNWWSSYQASENWSSLSQNCSTTVAEALKVGGANVSWYNAMDAHNAIWAPSDVMDYAKSIKSWEIRNDINSFKSFELYQQRQQQSSLNLNFSFPSGLF